MTDNISKQIASANIIYDSKSTEPTFVNVYGAIWPSRGTPPANLWPSEVNVNVGNVSSNEFNGVGDTIASLRFYLNLSGFPKTEKYAYITLGGAFAKENPDYFSHANSEKMGVSVVIAEDLPHLPHIPVPSGSILGPYPLVDGKATIRLLAFYIATRDKVSIDTINVTCAVRAYTQSQLMA